MWKRRSLLISLAMALGIFVVLQPIPAASQLRAPAWLSISLQQDTEMYIDINNIQRSSIGAEAHKLTFTTEFRPINGRAVSHYYTLERFDCARNRSGIVSADFRDSNDRVIQIDNFDVIDFQVLRPGSIGASVFNAVCFPQSDEVGPSPVLVAEALNRRRGLSATGRPSFPIGTVVVVSSGGFAVANETGYSALPASAEVQDLLAVPAGLRTFDTQRRYLRFDGRTWFNEDDNREVAQAPTFREGQLGSANSIRYVFYRGWRPFVWPSSKTYQNGDLEFFPVDLATFWGGQFWYGLVTTDTGQLLTDWREKTRASSRRN